MKTMQQSKWGLVFFFSLLFAWHSQGQQPAKYYRQLGVQLLEEKNYEAAHDALLAYRQKNRDDKWVLFQLTVSSYHLNRIDDMANYLEQYGQRTNVETILYTAHLLHAQQQYREAAKAYKRYLRRTRNLTDSKREQAKRMLRHCGNAIALLPDDTMEEQRTIDTKLYTPAGRVVGSPNYESIVYFSAYEEVGDTEVVRKAEQELIEPLPAHINTADSEQLIGFGNGGTWMYFRRGKEVWRENFEDQTLTNLTLPEEVNVVDLQIFGDSVLLFSSEELEGFGGSDLFYSRRVGGKWSKPVNLGAAINSAYDESHPFLDVDGRTLYFSSNHPERSIGGKDIVSSVFDLATGTWSTPQNLGITINAYADETYFSLHSTGQKAYFSSNQNGQQSIQQVEWSTEKKRQSPAFFFGDVKAVQQKQLLNEMTKFNALFEYRIQLQNTDSQDIELPKSLPYPYQWKNMTTGENTIGFGQYQSFSSAKEWLQIANDMGWSDAEIVVFQNGRWIDVEEAKELNEQHQTLQQYLEYKQQ
jgi:tetratricopeptide (TPR) repeat protein